MRALPQFWQRPSENQSWIRAQMIDPPADDAARALALFSEHVLQHHRVQAQFGHQLLHARILHLQLLHLPHLMDALHDFRPPITMANFSSADL